VFHFVIPGEPVPAGRPRAYINKALGRAGVHMPGKSSAWQATAAMLMRSEWGGRAPISAAVRAHLQFVSSRPKALLRKSSPEGRIWRTSRGDIDNLIKAALDAAVDAGVLLDDALVVSVQAEKLHVRKQEGACVALWLELQHAAPVEDLTMAGAR
jgi:Holliday junction resolvase RusA-like endonuclease